MTVLKAISDVHVKDWAQDPWDWDEAEIDIEEDFAVPSRLASVADYLEHLLEKSDNKPKKKKKSKKAGQKSKCNGISPNQASSNPVKQCGKGAAIYEGAQESSDDHLANETPANESTSNDVAVFIAKHASTKEIRFSRSFKMLTLTTVPSHLKDTFKSAYVECMSHPRRFAVNVTQRFAASESHIYVLFEIVENADGKIASYKWLDVDDWQTLHVDECTNARVSLIISPQFNALKEADFAGDVGFGGEEVHSVADVVRWMADILNDRMGITNEIKYAETFVKAAVFMETVTKAIGWQLRVDTPGGVYQEIQQKSQNVSPCGPDETATEDYCMEFSPFCGICSESLLPSVGRNIQATAMNACGHWFCNHCWTQHFQSRITQGDFNIICPGYECKSAIDIVTKMALMTTIDFYHHLDHQRDATLNRKSEWQWCPNPKCGHMACVVSGNGGVAVNCVCGWLWCSQCMQEAHWPATCKQAARYRDILNGNANKDKPIKLVSIDVKRCPTCNYPMIKEGGCPHMVCGMCGCNFCWNCHITCYDWSDHISLDQCVMEKYETVFLKDNDKQQFSLLKLALRHRKLRTKTAIRRYKTGAYRLTTKEFLKDKARTPESVAASHHQMTDELAKHLPITWISSESNLSSLAEKATMAQKGVKFLAEAHFVLEYLAIYMSDETLRKRHRKQLDRIVDRMNFIVRRMNKIRSARMDMSQVSLLTQTGKDCLKQLAYVINNTQDVAETE